MEGPFHIKGRYVLRKDDKIRKIGDLYDIVYYTNDGHELCFMVTRLQQDGSFKLNNNTLHQSHNDGCGNNYALHREKTLYIMENEEFIYSKLIEWLYNHNKTCIHE